MELISTDEYITRLYGVLPRGGYGDFTEPEFGSSDSVNNFEWVAYDLAGGWSLEFYVKRREKCVLTLRHTSGCNYTIHSFMECEVTDDGYLLVDDDLTILNGLEEWLNLIMSLHTVVGTEDTDDFVPSDRIGVVMLTDGKCFCDQYLFIDDLDDWRRRVTAMP